MNRIYVAKLSDAWRRNPSRAMRRGLPKIAGPELVTGGIHGAFWPVRQKIRTGELKVLAETPAGFVVPITLAWLEAFIEEICPDRDSPYANEDVWHVRSFLHTARESGRWALVGVWRAEGDSHPLASEPKSSHLGFQHTEAIQNAAQEIDEV